MFVVKQIEKNNVYIFLKLKKLVNGISTNKNLIL